MKTYNQFLETPFSEEVKPPEPPQDEGEDKNIKSKEKRQMQIKKQVLLKKMQAVRAGAGADIVASHTPDGELVEGKKKGLWDNIHAKRKRGEKPAKPGDKNYPKTLDVEEGAAWTKKSGKNPSGGLNEKGRKSYERDNPGSDLKAPQPEGGPRKRSFCARMGGVKGPMKKPDGSPTRKALALRKWKC